MSRHAPACKALRYPGIGECTCGAESERYQPVPVPKGDGRHDIGDDVRAAIVARLISDWSRDPDLTPEKVRQLAMWAGASVRALLHELGTLRDMEQSEGHSAKSEGNSGKEARRAFVVEIDAILSEVIWTFKAWTPERATFYEERLRALRRYVCDIFDHGRRPELDGPASGAPDAVDVRSTERTPSESTGALFEDLSVALEFVREIARVPCEWGCSSMVLEPPCIRCRAHAWLHSTKVV